MASHVLREKMFHDIEITRAEEKNGKGQDQPFSGETPSGKVYFGVWDGHGTNNVINKLREYIKNGQLSEFMDWPDPINIIANDLLDKKICGPYESSGATMNCGILENDVLTFMNCGDSRMFVFKNKILVFTSEDHSWDNAKEKERLGPEVYFTPNQGLKVLAEDELLGIYSEYMIQKNGNHLAVTQALGHNNCSPPHPDVFHLKVEPTDEIVAVSLSDGVTDMLICDEEGNIIPSDIQMIYEMSAEELKNKIQRRWTSPWNMTTANGQKTTNCCYSKRDCDDIGITRFVMTPKV